MRPRRGGFWIRPQEKFCGSIDDGRAVKAVVMIEIGQITRLAKALGAKRADAVATDTADPAKCRRGTVKNRNKARVGIQRREQLFDVRKRPFA